MFKLFLLLFLSLYANAAITIAMAANVQYAMDDIIKEFKKSNNIKIRKVVASSGQLLAQITHGAPYDIFLSANMKYPDFLYKNGFAKTKPKVYAKGSLILWSLKDIDLKNWQNSLINDAKNIAIPNPKIAPYGKAAIEALEKEGIFKKVKKKIIYTQSVSQANQYITSMVVDIGFSSKSVVLSPNLRKKGKWIEIDKRLYNPINQGVIITKYGYKNNRAQSLKFYKFLFSKKAKDIFKKYGYEVE
ncbi:MAG TPA: molybdate ABC transporter substrate-binding protein [Campylobacterales bacterium]|nr:molybdate ABC transporter substrate-binding protein [Campylobacterales bacterium]